TQDHRNVRYAERKTRFRRARDRFRLAALFRADAGIGSGCVHQRDYRNAETVRHFHQSDGLSIAFRTRPAEIVLEAAFGVGALFVADDADAFAAEAAEAADDCG